MAGDLFCCPCACVFVLCEHMAFLLVFCVPCALMSIVLTPTILLPDYWLIAPPVCISLPSSFAPFIISLGLIYETNVRLKFGRTVVSTQNLEFINMDVSGGYDQISRQL